MDDRFELRRLFAGTFARLDLRAPKRIASFYWNFGIYFNDKIDQFIKQNGIGLVKSNK